jgi:hypothetical protein
MTRRISCELKPWFMTSIGPCILIYSYSTTNKMHLFPKLFILVKHSACFGRSFRPSSGAQNCTYSNGHMSNSCCYLLLAAAVWHMPVAVCTVLRSWSSIFYTPWSRVLLKKLTGMELVKKFPAFMQPEGSSPHSQAHANCPYPELAPSSPYTHIPLPEDLWAPDDGRKDRPKHVERFTRVNNLGTRCILLVVL